jgi:hypothetical protein
MTLIARQTIPAISVTMNKMMAVFLFLLQIWIPSLQLSFLCGIGRHVRGAALRRLLILPDTHYTTLSSRCQEQIAKNAC